MKICKEHGGPIVNLNELQEIVKKHSKGNLKQILRQEIGFQKTMHQLDAKERPHLYKMNFLTPQVMIENLSILLEEPGGPDEVKEYEIFPSEEEIMIIINQRKIDNITINDKFKLLQPLAVIWDTNSGKRNWYIGFYMGKNSDDTIRIDHLTRLNKGKTY